MKQPHIIANGKHWIKVSIHGKNYQYITKSPDDVPFAKKHFRKGLPWEGINFLKKTCLECNRITCPNKGKNKGPKLIRIVEVVDIPNDVDPMKFAAEAYFTRRKTFGIHFKKLLMYNKF